MPLQNQSMFPGQDEENLCNYINILLKLYSLHVVINNTWANGYRTAPCLLLVHFKLVFNMDKTL